MRVGDHPVGVCRRDRAGAVVGPHVRQVGVDRLAGGRALILDQHQRGQLDRGRRVVRPQRRIGQELAQLVVLIAGAAARTAAELVAEVYGEPLTATNAGWLLSQTLCYLRHLEIDGRVASEPDGSAERWRPS